MFSAKSKSFSFQLIAALAIIFVSTSNVVHAVEVCNKNAISEAVTPQDGFKVFQTSDELKTEVDSWFQNPIPVELAYGPIGDWCFGSAVNSMAELFQNRYEFNAGIEGWNVGQVTNMRRMFSSAYKFNKPVGDWNVSNVTDMNRMFFLAAEFNQPLAGWDVSQVTTMNFMFGSARAFNQPLGKWKVINVTSMGNMFAFTDSFNQYIGDWDVSQVTDMFAMFRDALVFNQNLCPWGPRMFPGGQERNVDVVLMFNNSGCKYDLSPKPPVRGRYYGYCAVEFCDQA